MSEPPEKQQHPWAEYYADRGVSRPPMADLVRTPAPPPPPKKNEPETKPAELSPELAAAVAAVTETVTPGVTAAPFITAMQREALVHELRRQRRLRWAKRAGFAALGLVVLHFTITRFFYRVPTDEALQDYAQTVANAVLALYSTNQQPLQTDTTAIQLTDAVDSRRIRYAAEVTLRLRQPLYIPAITNGTAAYRQLQQTLENARQQDLKFKLFPAAENPPPPDLPLLIQVSHRAGDTLVVRVPFEARRFGWGWRIEPARLALRSVNRNLDGSALERYAGTSYVTYDPDHLAEVRNRMRHARDYIVAVAKEVQKRADAPALDDNPPPAMPDASIESRPAVDPNAPAIEVANQPALPDSANRPAIDPDAPALDLSTLPAKEKPAREPNPPPQKP